MCVVNCIIGERTLNDLATGTSLVVGSAESGSRPAQEGAAATDNRSWALSIHFTLRNLPYVSHCRQLLCLKPTSQNTATALSLRLPPNDSRGNYRRETHFFITTPISNQRDAQISEAQTSPPTPAMNRPDYLSLVSSFSSSAGTLHETLVSLADYAEKFRPTEATTQMAAALVAELTSRLVYLLASLPAPLLFVVALVASVSLVRLVHRVVSFVTRLAFRLVFWALIAGVVAVMYEKGLEGSVAAARETLGYVFDVGVFFWREWERFEKERERQGRVRPNMAF